MSVGWVGAENHKKAKKIYKETPTTSEAEIMENSMKIANKFSHFHSASPGSVCHAMFVFYGFRPQCVHCNNYTTQSTQKEPRGSTSKKKWKEQIKNRTEIHSYPLTVGISHNRCRKKRESRLLRFCINFIIFRLVMYLAKSLALTSTGQMVSEHSRAENVGFSI